MLHRFNIIRGVGNISQLNVPAGEKFSTDLNLIFAPNRSGKSTLCYVLTSLSQNDTDYVLVDKAPHGTGYSGEIEIQIQGDSGLIELDGSEWSNPPANIHVFDQNFIHRNVMVSDRGITGEIRQNLVTVAFGERIVILTSRRDNARRKQQKLRAEKEESETEILAFISEQDADLKCTKDELYEIEVVEDSAELIKTKLKELSKSESQEQLKGTGVIVMDIAEFPSDITGHFEVAIEGIEQIAIQETLDHISKLAPKENGEQWIGQGFQRAKETQTCPFCARGLSGLELFTKHYTGFFDEKYMDHANSFKGVENQIRKYAKGIDLQKQKEVATQNKLAIELWNEFLDPPIVVPQTSEMLSQLEEKLETLEQEAIRAVKRKKTSLTSRLSENNPFYKALSEFNKVRHKIKKYNEDISSIAKQLAEEKQTLGDMKSSEELADEIRKLKLAELLWGPELLEDTKRLHWLVLKINWVKKVKERLQDKISEEAGKLGESFCRKVNFLLNKLGVLGLSNDKKTGISLEKLNYSPDGRTSKVSASIVLALNDKPISTESTSSSERGVYIHNSISAGEKSILALVYFLTQLYSVKPSGGFEPRNLSGHTIVFDDPFTSLDEDRRVSIRNAITSLVVAGAQVIVFSHSKSFLQYFYDTNILRQNKKKIQNLLLGWNGSIHNLSLADSEAFLPQPDVIYGIQKIFDQVNLPDIDVDLKVLATHIISTLEYFLKSASLDGNFYKKVAYKSLGGILKEISDHKKMHGVFPEGIKNIDEEDITQISEINDAIAGEKHSKLGTKESAISVPEAKKIGLDTIDLIHNC